MTPIVSVIALNYNQEEYCLETLDSIIHQTFKDIELIIMDDCSTDASVDKIQNWVNKADTISIKFIVNKENIGICKTLNYAIGISSGQYISIIACDDLMSERKLEVQLSELKSNADDNLALVYSDAYLINQYGKKIGSTWFGIRPPIERYGNDLFRAMLVNKYILLQASLIRKDILLTLGGFDESLSYEDYDILLRIVNSYEVKYSEYISCSYRKFVGGQSNVSFSRHSESTLKVLLKHKGKVSQETDAVITKLINFNILGVLGENYEEGRRMMQLNGVKGELNILIKWFSPFKFIFSITNLLFKYRLKLHSIRKYFYKLRN